MREHERRGFGRVGILGLILIPVVVAAAAFVYYKREITAAEFALQLTLSLVVAIGGWFAVRSSGLESVEHWNGRITAKDKGTQACCHCTRVCDTRDKDGRCTSDHEECSHITDHWWSLDVSTGDQIRHECDGGSEAPSWWTAAKIGEAAAIEHSYTNYLLADPESILHHDGAVSEADIKSVPPFPSVHGKYRVSKVVTHGGARAPGHWQTELMELNADLGERVQRCFKSGGSDCGRLGVDVIFVLTSRRDPAWASAVEAAWVYGPKNALIVVMGTDGKQITWARVVTISDVHELKITLRDGLVGRSLDDPGLVAWVGEQVERLYARTALSEFDYMLSAAAPKGWALAGLYLLVLLVSIGLTVFMHAQDVFGGGTNLRRRSYRHYYD